MITRGKIEELWVGDKLLHIPSGTTCKFESYDTNADQVIVRFGGRIQKVEREELELLDELEEVEEIPELFRERERLDSTTSSHVEPQEFIDLHIEILRPETHSTIHVTRILNIQVEACERFVEQAFQYGLKRIVIIHGKGQGILEKEVERILSQYKEEISMILPINDGGAKEVWLK